MTWTNPGTRESNQLVPVLFMSTTHWEKREWQPTHKGKANNLTVSPLQRMIFTLTAVMVGLICVASFTFLSSLIVMGRLMTPKGLRCGGDHEPIPQEGP